MAIMNHGFMVEHLDNLIVTYEIEGYNTGCPENEKLFFEYTMQQMENCGTLIR